MKKFTHFNLSLVFNGNPSDPWSYVICRPNGCFASGTADGPEAVYTRLNELIAAWEKYIDLCDEG